ncbi:biotin/lipoyl-containing protein, partial [Sphingomonas bacterium]|uniref:biotin/lipoyl-containing protein n=1 Tax=Sphingomonas bacterium TaxID=1895847 RepID=UPI001577640F
MANELKMPALSPTMEKGTLARWLVKEGDAVRPGDVLAEIETDKATMELEAADEGVVASLVVPDGTDDVAVGTVIALIADRAEEGAEAVLETVGAAAAPAMSGAAAQAPAA